MITTIILDLKQNYVLHTKMLNEKNMDFAMLSGLFYTRTVHRKPSSKAHSNVAYCRLSIVIV